MSTVNTSVAELHERVNQWDQSLKEAAVAGQMKKVISRVKQEIKPYWALGLSRPDIKAALDKGGYCWDVLARWNEWNDRKTEEGQQAFAKRERTYFRAQEAIPERPSAPTQVSSTALPSGTTALAGPLSSMSFALPAKPFARSSSEQHNEGSTSAVVSNASHYPIQLGGNGEPPRPRGLEASKETSGMEVDPSRADQEMLDAKVPQKSFAAMDESEDDEHRDSAKIQIFISEDEARPEPPSHGPRRSARVKAGGKGGNATEASGDDQDVREKEPSTHSRSSAVETEAAKGGGKQKAPERAKRAVKPRHAEPRYIINAAGQQIMALIDPKCVQCARNNLECIEAVNNSTCVSCVRRKVKCSAKKEEGETTVRTKTRRTSKTIALAKEHQDNDEFEEAEVANNVGAKAVAESVDEGMDEELTVAEVVKKSKGKGKERQRDVSDDVQIVDMTSAEPPEGRGGADQLGRRSMQEEETIVVRRPVATGGSSKKPPKSSVPAANVADKLQAAKRVNAGSGNPKPRPLPTRQQNVNAQEVLEAFVSRLEGLLSGAPTLREVSQQLKATEKVLNEKFFNFDKRLNEAVGKVGGLLDVIDVHDNISEMKKILKNHKHTLGKMKDTIEIICQKTGVDFEREHYNHYVLEVPDFRIVEEDDLVKNALPGSPQSWDSTGNVDAEFTIGVERDAYDCAEQGEEDADGKQDVAEELLSEDDFGFAASLALQAGDREGHQGEDSGSTEQPAHSASNELAAQSSSLNEAPAISHNAEISQARGISSAAASLPALKVTPATPQRYTDLLSKVQDARDLFGPTLGAVTVSQSAAHLEGSSSLPRPGSPMQIDPAPPAPAAGRGRSSSQASAMRPFTRSQSRSLSPALQITVPIAGSSATSPIASTAPVTPDSESSRGLKRHREQEQDADIQEEAEIKRRKETPM